MKKILTIAAMAVMMACYSHAAIYIVGNNPFGDWNPAQGVEMTDNGDGTYSYTAEINGTIWFVFADGLSSDWTVFNNDFRYGPANGDEQVNFGTWTTTQKAGDHGAYRLTGSGEEYEFTFDLTNGRFMVNGDAFIDPPKVYTVAGAPDALFGTEWDINNPDNEMTEGAGGLYVWTKKSVNLKAGSIEFKVVANHDWGQSWPNYNYVAEVPVDGLYDVTITFDPKADEDANVSCSVVLKSAPQPTVYGDVNGDDEVNIADINSIVDAIFRDDNSARFDVNGDGEVNVADISTVIDIILRGAPKDLTGDIGLDFNDGDGSVYIYYTGDELVTLTVYLDGVETELQDGFLWLGDYGEYTIEVIARARGYKNLYTAFTVNWEGPIPPPIYDPVISITVEDDYVIVEATGQGVVRLFIDGQEVENPCYLERLDEDYPVRIDASSEVEGLKMMTTSMDYFVPAKEGDEPDPRDEGFWAVVLDKDGNEVWIELQQGVNGDFVALMNLYSDVYGYETSSGEVMVRYHYVIDGIHYGAGRDMQQAVIGIPMDNPLYEGSSNNYCVPAGYSYVLGVMIDWETGAFYSYAAKGGWCGNH